MFLVDLRFETDLVLKNLIRDRLKSDMKGNMIDF